MKMKFIDNNHYRISDKDATKLAKATPLRRLPRWGYEVMVTLEDGRMAWLSRTPHKHLIDSPKRGWVWCVRPQVRSRHAI